MLLTKMRIISVVFSGSSHNSPRAGQQQGGRSCGCGGNNNYNYKLVTPPAHHHQHPQHHRDSGQEEEEEEPECVKDLEAEDSEMGNHQTTFHPNFPYPDKRKKEGGASSHLRCCQNSGVHLHRRPHQINSCDNHHGLLDTMTTDGERVVLESGGCATPIVAAMRGLVVGQSACESPGVRGIEDLPEEVLYHLLGFLFDSNDVALLPSPVAGMLVCSQWYRLLKELEAAPLALAWRTRRDEIAFRRRPDYVKRKVFVTAKKSRYEGEWVAEFGKHGEGTFRYADGDYYRGEWHKEKRQGKGVYVWASGHTYTGEWLNGERHGQGTYTSPCGNYYVGQWRHNKRHGHGLWIDSRGTKYDGEYVEGRAEGKGVMITPLGSWYQGEWVAGCGHGWGVYSYANGERYEGQWAKGKRDGWGVYNFASGDTYSGFWAEGVQHGFGTHFFCGGGKFEGEWDQGVAVGRPGTLTARDGRIIQCTWDEVRSLNPSMLPQTGQVIGSDGGGGGGKSSRRRAGKGGLLGLWPLSVFLPHQFFWH